jgi:hypothetical protein
MWGWSGHDDLDRDAVALRFPVPADAISKQDGVMSVHSASPWPAVSACVVVAVIGTITAICAWNVGRAGRRTTLTGFNIFHEVGEDCIVWHLYHLARLDQDLAYNRSSKETD